MKKLVMLTAYDFPTAKIIDSVGIDYILVGDSLAMTTLGHKNTKSITMDQMLNHTSAVCRGVQNTPVIADMPINSYDEPKQALENAQKFLTAGAEMVKIEGYKPEIVSTLRKNKTKVVGHLGLLPQTAEKYRVMGKEKKEADNIYFDSINLDKLGIELLILECVPVSLAKKITDKIKTPTIGIGAGKYCDGQVLVLADILGLTDKKLKMAKQYADVKLEITKAVKAFKNEVQQGIFPGKENSFN